MSVRVLLVDDDESTAILAEGFLGSLPERGYDVTWVADYEHGRAELTSGSHDVCLLDNLLGERSGLELLREVRAAGCQVPVVLLTASANAAVDEAALAAGASDFLGKAGLTAETLDRSLRYALAHARARADLLTVLNQLSLAIALVDADGRIAFVNEAGQRLFGGIAGRAWPEAFGFAAADRKAVEALLAAPPGERRKLSARVSSGVPVDVDVQDAPGQPGRTIWFFYDRSDVEQLRALLDEKATFERMVGKSPAMQAVYQSIRDFAPLDWTVLVSGESGTGKELAARALHAASPRAKKPFVAVNCAGLSESLLASQLFGHKRGAFTGAVADHKGFFEAAQGGTLFLDEVGELPASIQASLLRVLQEKEIMRLGESTPHKIDVRIVTATHRDLAAEVQAGRFRLDLLYRLKIATVALPPLRARLVDLPLLVASFLGKLRATTGKAIAGASPDAMRKLMAHRWPGNVRELQSVIEVAAIRARGTILEVEDLDLDVIGVAPAPTGDERARIRDALARSGGSRVKAAKLLGISRATFYRRLAELGIDPGE